MAYDAQFIDGFDKYGPAGNATALALMEADEWTSIIGTGATVTIVPPLSPLGQAVQIVPTAPFSGTAFGGLRKQLGANYARHIGGSWVKSNFGNVMAVKTFEDTGTAQLTVTIETDGLLGIRLGDSTGTLIATSSAVVSVNSTHVVEWDVTINNSTGAYTVWLDGVLAGLSATGVNTRGGTANNYYNQEAIGGSGNAFSSVTGVWDNLYSRYFIASGSGDTPLLDSSVVETEFPSADSTVNFTPQAGVLGQAYSTTTSTNAPGANQLFLRQFTPPVNCTLNSVSCVPEATSAGANFMAVAYADSGGTPHTLLSAGPQVTGTTAGTALTANLTTPQVLTAGTPYWIGFITDTSVVLAEVDGTTTGEKAANTYSGGAPNPAPGMTSAQPSWEIWGNLTALAHNYSQVDVNPPLGLLSYNQDSTVNDQDLFTFPNLSGSARTIHTVAIKTYGEKSDSGARTVNMVMKSSGTTGNGSNAGIAPGTSFSWLDSYFDTDPHTSASWTVSGVNAALGGYDIAS